MRRWLVGVDVGGSGSRVRAVSDAVQVEIEGDGAEASPEGAGSAVIHALEAISTRLVGGAVIAVAVGSTGIATLSDDNDTLRERIRELLPGAVVVLSADAVTAHLGALEGEPGATVAAGTGAIGLSHAEDGTIVRVDGWGHLLGDIGSASWIGRRGLTAALRAHDGRDPSGIELLSRATESFGAPESWPAQLYGRDDRAAVLGSFAPSVLASADAGDPEAGRIVEEAAQGLAQTAVAALRRPGVPATLALTGGLFRSRRLFDSVAEKTPDGVRVRAAAGTPLDGAVHLAKSAAAGAVSPLSNDDLILW